jgi:hypothetical protein
MDVSSLYSGRPRTSRRSLRAALKAHALKHAQGNDLVGSIAVRVGFSVVGVVSVVVGVEGACSVATALFLAAVFLLLVMVLVAFFEVDLFEVVFFVAGFWTLVLPKVCSERLWSGLAREERRGAILEESVWVFG